jgi:hypothetical protein
MTGGRIGNLLSGAGEGGPTRQWIRRSPPPGHPEPWGDPRSVRQSWEVMLGGLRGSLPRRWAEVPFVTSERCTAAVWVLRSDVVRRRALQVTVRPVTGKLSA